jgi:two-component SAPR family response regulator
MTAYTLRDCRILVVEDEYLLADEIQIELSDAGAIVLGPVARLEDAMELIDREHDIDAAILDVSLGGEMVYPAADLLARRKVPFVFTTGYDASAIPPRFEHVVRCQKPVDMVKVIFALERIAGTETWQR